MARGGCWHNLNKLFFKPWSSQKRRCLHAHMHTHTHTRTHTQSLSRSVAGQLPNPLSPRVLIMPSAQYGKSISRPRQEWRTSFPPFSFSPPSRVPQTQICILLTPTPAGPAKLSASSILMLLCCLEKLIFRRHSHFLPFIGSKSKRRLTVITRAWL